MVDRGPARALVALQHRDGAATAPDLATVAGATGGIAIQLIIAAIGLTSLLHFVAETFEWLRWAGAGYLVYLGIRQWQGSGQKVTVDTASVSRKNLFVQGLVVTIPNPKSLIFIAAFLPQFIEASLPAGIQFAIILPTFLFITFSVTSIWANASPWTSSVGQTKCSQMSRPPASSGWSARSY